MSKEKEQDYTIEEASYTFKISVAIKDNLWNTFEHSLKAKVKPGADMKKVNEELWNKVIVEVENKIEESQKLYNG